MIRAKELKAQAALPYPEVQIIMQIEQSDRENFTSFIISTTLDRVEDEIISWGRKNKNNKSVKKENYKRLKHLINSHIQPSDEVLFNATFSYICCCQAMSTIYANNTKSVMKLAINIYDRSESMTEFDEIDETTFESMILILNEY